MGAVGLTDSVADSEYVERGLSHSNTLIVKTSNLIEFIKSILEKLRSKLPNGSITYAIELNFDG